MVVSWQAPRPRDQPGRGEDHTGYQLISGSSLGSITFVQTSFASFMFLYPADSVTTPEDQTGYLLINKCQFYNYHVSLAYRLCYYTGGPHQVIEVSGSLHCLMLGGWQCIFYKFHVSLACFFCYYTGCHIRRFPPQTSPLPWPTSPPLNLQPL